MSQIKGKDTKPELVVRSLLHRMGYRFRLHKKDLPGKPDIVLKKYKTVFFVNGCFWHRHKKCKYSYTPKSRVDFWNRKFEETVKRDQLCRQQLKIMGWKVVVIWECETKDVTLLAERCSKILIST